MALSPEVKKALDQNATDLEKGVERLGDALEDLAIAQHVRKAADGLFDVHDNGRVLRRFTGRETAEEFVRNAWRKSFAKPELEKPRGHAPETDPSLDTEPGFRGRDGRKGARLDNVTHPPTKKPTRIL